MRILHASWRGGTVLFSATEGEAGALGRDLWWCLFACRVPHTAFQMGTGHERCPVPAVHPGPQSLACPSSSCCAGSGCGISLFYLTLLGNATAEGKAAIAQSEALSFSPLRVGFSSLLFSLKHCCGLRLMGYSVLAQR